MNKYLYALACLLALCFTSCSESDEESTEYANWQARNDTYFAAIYQRATDSISAGSKNWHIYKALTKSQTEKGAITDYIVANVISEGNSSTATPLQTDSVRVFYEGRLIPSDSYPEGKVFDCTWNGEYNVKTMVPTQFAVASSSIVTGFTTALQYMHVGDRWKVYIPYQLGYNAKAQSAVPAYSTLIFDLTLHSFWRNGYTSPSFK